MTRMPDMRVTAPGPFVRVTASQHVCTREFTED